jgi:two-component system sensor histidine kinase MprB
LGTATALIALLVLLASALLTTRELRAQVDADLERRLTLTSEGEVPRPIAPFDLRGRRRAPVNLDALYRMLGPDGTVIVDTTDGELPLTEAVVDLAIRTTDERTFETVTIDDERFRMIVGGLTDRRGGINLGAAQIAVGVEGVESSIGALARRSAAIAGLLVLAAAGVGWLLAGRTVEPLTQLTGQAEHIARTDDLTAVVQVDRTDEIGRLASAFAAMLTALRTSREQQQRLVADAGHEFRTPLTALRTNLETLQRRRKQLTDQQTDELIEAALSESIELTNLATELVDLSTDASATGEEVRLVDLGELAASVVRRYVSRTTDPIEVDGDAAPVEVRVSQIERALSNLIANAIAWNEPGESITVRIDGTTLSVADHGPGIPEVDLPLVFDRFHRSATARGRPGSGLGLSIVRHIVEGHGGTVFARNRAEGGAEVGFTLPA